MAMLKANAVDEGYSGGGAGRLYVGSLFADDPQPVIPGDADGNGEVNANDALTVLSFSMGLIDPSEIDLAAADFDGDGSVTALDALTILRKAVGLLN